MTTQAGGLFAVLVFIHFLVDWGVQTQWEAERKSSNWRVRALHSGIYTLGFLPVVGVLWGQLTVGRAIVIGLVLFFSHWIEDTYYPVYLWARYVRQVGIRNIAEFKQWAHSGSLPLILTITIDQIIHVTFLWIVVWIILK